MFHENSVKYLKTFIYIYIGVCLRVFLAIILLFISHLQENSKNKGITEN